jgi:hypothetical protein
MKAERKFITVGGKKIPTRHTLWAFMASCKTCSMSMEQVEQVFNSGDLVKIVDFCAEFLKESANEEIEIGIVPYTTKSAYAWIEEMGMTGPEFTEIAKQIGEGIAHILAHKNQVEKSQPEGEKKSATTG